MSAGKRLGIGIVFASLLMLSTTNGEERSAEVRTMALEKRLNAQKRQISALRSQSLSQSGKRIYLSACQACHGMEGDGHGPAAPDIEGSPSRDFTGGIYKLRSTPYTMLPSENDLVRTIREGMPGTDMPSWKGLLTTTEMKAVAIYLKTFSPRFKKEPISKGLVIPKETPSTKKSIIQGRQLYRNMGCDQCHGSLGKGNGEMASSLQDDWGAPIRPTDFTRGIFKSGKTNADLFRSISTGLNGTPMPSYDFMEPDQRWDLVHYLKSLKKRSWWKKLITVEETNW